MRTSESTKEIAAALAKAQASMRGAIKDAQNPHFRNEYATLASVIDAARDPLTANGLAVVQGLASNDTGLVVTTRLMHASGEWIEDDLTVPLTKRDAQGMGSAATYGRRYAYAAMVGIAQVDDDANGATGKRSEAPEGYTPAQETALQTLRDASLNGMAALEQAWKAATPAIRNALKDELPSLKEAAAKAEPVAA